VTHAELARAVADFTEAFNREDLDGVMAWFADDALYDEFDGKEARGREAIRAAFVPQFRGDFGRMRFVTEDLFVDASAEKALISWLCTLERGGKKRGWRGLDILHFRAGKVIEKRTYAKAERLKLEELPA
jgi:ketosteroid isomerase-like protein